MASERRIEKLNELFKEEITKILARELEFPENTLATVTRVAITRDMYYATVFVSLLGAHPKAALESLRKKTYNVQKLLNRRLPIRPVPKIRFALDEEEMRRERVERSLTKLKKNGEI